MNTTTLSVVIEKLEKTSSRNTLGELLANLLKELKTNEVDKLIYLFQSRVYPKYIPIEFNVGNRQIINFIARYFNYTNEKVSKDFLKVGDLGDLIYTYFDKNKSKNIQLVKLYEYLNEFALISGKDSVNRKYMVFEKILDDIDSLSAKYLVRILSGSIRLGLSDKTIIDSLSIMLKSDKSLSESIERAYGTMSDLGILAMMLHEIGEKALREIKVTPGIPLASKLVEREKDSNAIWDRMPNCFIQPKYDGIRCQIHMFEGEDLLRKVKNEQTNQIGMLDEKVESNVRLFSRNQESLTEMFPDIVDEVKKLNLKSVILDSEVIGFDEKTNSFIPFQETIQRKRKYDVGTSVENIPVKAFVFDILELDGKDLSVLPIEERLKILKELISKSKTKKIIVTDTREAKSQKDLEKYFQVCIKEGLEGIITKAKGTTYDPGTRNYDWIKLKRSTDSSLNDSIDGVVLGYYTGKGARAEFGIGTILVGIFDSDEQRIKTIAKVGTGFSEEDLKRIYEELKQIRIKNCPNNLDVDKRLEPDIWVEPKIVVEIEADEITKSVSHTSGFSLRFPRIKRWGRDKTYEQTTTIKELNKMFEMRKV